jgi:hypothetical protein
MADPIVHQRTFLPDGNFKCFDCHEPMGSKKMTYEPIFLSPPAPIGPGSMFRTVNTSPPTPTYAITQRRFPAMRMLGSSLTPINIVEKQTQGFDLSCTDWERQFSVLAGNPRGYMPVVDENLTVVGHLFDSTKMRHSIYLAGVIGADGVSMSVENDRATMTIELLNQMLDSEDAVGYVDRKAPPGPWAFFHQQLQPGYDLLGFCGVDGRIFQVIRGAGQPGAEAESFNIDDLLIITALVKLGARLGEKLISAAGRKLSKFVTKLAIRGATKEIGELLARELAKKQAAREASMMFKGLKLSRGYHPDMGIAEEHFAKMVEAARETQTIAIFRANKPRAIPLVRQGAHGKPMWAKFKTSSETGVLTAKNASERMIAYENGAFVVHPDTIAKRTARRVSIQNGKEVVEEIPLANMNQWTLEPGQVVFKDGKPVVGDYDLLGAAPVKSPGSSVALVPENTAYGDWNGPVVKKYANAFNSKLKEPMVLHGAQDQYGGIEKYMGLTDDTAYAVFPDGKTFIMRGKSEQKAFYDALGRVPKSPGAPIGVPGWRPTVLQGGKK